MSIYIYIYIYTVYTFTFIRRFYPLYIYIAWMQCKSLWIKASDKCKCILLKYVVENPWMFVKKKIITSFYTYFGPRVPFFWWSKMVALGELLPLPDAIFTTTQLGIDNWDNKILNDDHSYWKSLQVATDISIGLNQMLYHRFSSPLKESKRLWHRVRSVLRNSFSGCDIYIPIDGI